MMDEIWTWTALIFALGTVGFLFGMLALQRAREIAEANKWPVPRIPGLTPEQTFGLGGVVISAVAALFLFWRG